MLKRRRRDEEQGELMKTAVEVASVKAQVQGILVRMRNALDELEETVGVLPDEDEEVALDDKHPA